MTCRATTRRSFVVSYLLRLLLPCCCSDLDKCVDTILDLLNDPMEVARKAQMEEDQKRLEQLDSTVQSQDMDRASSAQQKPPHYSP